MCPSEGVAGVLCAVVFGRLHANTEKDRDGVGFYPRRDPKLANTTAGGFSAFYPKVRRQFRTQEEVRTHKKRHRPQTAHKHKPSFDRAAIYVDTEPTATIVP
jgi:hypothetical protein